MQLASKMGLISFEKSSGWLAGGGNVFTCSGVKAACASTEAPQNKPKVNLGQRGFTEVNLLQPPEDPRTKIQGKIPNPKIQIPNLKLQIVNRKSQIPNEQIPDGCYEVRGI